MFLLIGLFLTFTLGYLLINIFDDRLNSYEQIMLSVVIGFGMMTQLLFVLNLLNIRYSVASVLVSLSLLDLFLGLLGMKRIVSSVKALKVVSLSAVLLWLRALSLYERVIVLALSFLVITAFGRALFWPVWLWDALALYDYRAKIFFEAGGIAKSLAISSLPLHSYPPMTSLAHAFVYILGGGGANPQFIYALFYIALIVTFYISLRKYCRRWMSLLFTLFLASTPMFVEFSANAYTNLPYTFYFGMGTIYLYRFMQEERWGIFIIAALLLGLAGWTRSPTATTPHISQGHASPRPGPACITSRPACGPSGAGRGTSGVSSGSRRGCARASRGSGRGRVCC